MNTMREDFEAFAKGDGLDLTRFTYEDGYRSALTADAWRIWQAARQPVGENPAWRDELVREAYNRGLAEGLNADRQPVGEVAACSGGFVISNGSGKKYMGWGQVGPVWVEDVSRALWLVRRADADALADENEDAQSILPVARCALPPNGWACTLASGHEGPCPTIAAPPEGEA